MNIPTEILEAARKVELYMKTHVIGSWALNGICSRDHETRLDDLTNHPTIEQIEKQLHALGEDFFLVTRANGCTVTSIRDLSESHVDLNLEPPFGLEVQSIARETWDENGDLVANPDGDLIPS